LSTNIVVRRVRPVEYGAMNAAYAELSQRALSPNPHMAPPAIEAACLLIPHDAIVILAAWQSEALGSERLVGIWALARRRGWRGGFASHLVAPLLPLYEVSSVPVIDRDHFEEVVQAMLRHVNAATDLPKTLLLPLLPLEGRLSDALRELCRATGSRFSTYESWQRPMMLPQPGDDAEHYLRRALGPSYKKRMQQFRAAAKAGGLSFQRRRGLAARDGFEDFLTLEARGWKGQARTAILSRTADAAYFRKLVAGFADIDALQLDTLLLEDRPIAMGVLIESAGTRHFLKIAYDESQSRLSPGRTLTIAMIRGDFAGTPPLVFDSGAGDGVDAGTYVWGERLLMGHVVIGLASTGLRAANLAASARSTLRRLRDRRKP
jgi:hypothetical protein